MIENPLAILDKLLAVNHGWWADEIEDVTQPDGTTRSRLRGRPYFSPSYLRLYGYGSGAGRPTLNKVIDRADWKKVLTAIRKASAPGAVPVSDTLRVRTARGETKLVEVYMRRLCLDDGTPVLASLHSDLTVSNDLQWIHRTVLEKLNAFVFVKSWSAGSGRFVFRYVNQRLADALGAGSPEEVIGRSDADYFADDQHARGFRLADEQVHTAADPDFILVREETFCPAPGHRGGSQVPLRLVTLKTPYLAPADSPGGGGRQVLGIAFDVTPVTDLLRVVAETSSNGVYVKDGDGRYQLANSTFLRLIGVGGEHDLLDRTFREVVGTLHVNALDGHDEHTLVSLIEAEDQSVLSGADTRRVRPAVFSGGDEWLTEKRLVHCGKDRSAHIVAVATPLFWGRSADTLDRLPQCVSVKRYVPDADSPDSQLRLVWANRRFLERHGKRAMSDIRGLTDYDLWPRRQADAFRRVDLKAIKIAQELEGHSDWGSLDADARWSRMTRRLVAEQCWEYRETQRGDQVNAVLQTTKWAERIGDTWFVVVVYSDVTVGNAEQQQYHDMTVHTVRGDFGPVGVAAHHIELYQEQARSGAADLAELHKAKACLDDATANINWFLKYHLELLRMDVRLDEWHAGELAEIATAEMLKARRATTDAFYSDVIVGDGFHELASVHVDREFVRAIVAELIRNGQKAMLRRNNTCRNIERGMLSAHTALSQLGWRAVELPYVPWLTVTLDTRHGFLVMIFRDNGDACVSLRARTALMEKFRLIKEDPYARQDLRLGLAFCLIAIERHNGSLDLRATDEATEFTLRLPLTTGWS